MWFAIIHRKNYIHYIDSSHAKKQGLPLPDSLIPLNHMTSLYLNPNMKHSHSLIFHAELHFMTLFNEIILRVYYSDMKTCLKHSRVCTFFLNCVPLGFFQWHFAGLLKIVIYGCWQEAMEIFFTALALLMLSGRSLENPWNWKLLSLTTVS